jgi:hypothetical protein
MRRCGLESAKEAVVFLVVQTRKIRVIAIRFSFGLVFVSLGHLGELSA